MASAKGVARVERQVTEPTAACPAEWAFGCAFPGCTAQSYLPGCVRIAAGSGAASGDMTWPCAVATETYYWGDRGHAPVPYGTLVFMIGSLWISRFAGLFIVW